MKYSMYHVANCQNNIALHAVTTFVLSGTVVYDFLYTLQL